MTVKKQVSEKKSAADKFDIPELTPSNTDSEISASLEKLKTAKASIQENRKDLKEEVNTLNFFDIHRKK